MAASLSPPLASPVVPLKPPSMHLSAPPHQPSPPSSLDQHPSWPLYVVALVTAVVAVVVCCIALTILGWTRWKRFKVHDKSEVSARDKTALAGEAHIKRHKKGVVAPSASLFLSPIASVAMVDEGGERAHQNASVGQSLTKGVPWPRDDVDQLHPSQPVLRHHEPRQLILQDHARWLVDARLQIERNRANIQAVQTTLAESI
mmetsp:Transcript_38688/g.77463  ORF Transcript_38688/g.77463 Transcript_38688/m.77463 type:complete len:202 (+) Transcript_38688:73-678(+)